MSTVNQQEVADSGKEDNYCLVSTPTPVNQGDGSIEAVAQAITDDISKPTHSKANIDQDETKSLCGFDKCAGDSKDFKDTSIATDVKCNLDQEFAVNADEIIIVPKDEGHEQQSLANIIENSNVMVQTGYKETELDEVSDSDFELRWTDEEGDDHKAQPLSDEALKRLDVELGITDEENSEVTSQEKLHIITEIAADNIMEVTMSKEIISEKTEAGNNDLEPTDPLLPKVTEKQVNNCDIDETMKGATNPLLPKETEKQVKNCDIDKTMSEPTDPLLPKVTGKQFKNCDTVETMLDLQMKTDHYDITIKHPSIGKSDNKSVEKVENQQLSESVKIDCINVPSDEIVIDIKTQPMDISPEFENKAFDTITVTSNSPMQNKADIITPLPETNIDTQDFTVNKNMECTLENDLHLNRDEKVSEEPNFERNDIIVKIPQNSDIELNIQSPKEVDENNSSDSNMTMQKNELDIGNFNTAAKTSNYPTPDENSESSSATIETMSKSINDAEILNVVKDSKLNTDNVSITVKNENFEVNLDESMTPDVFCDSIKINTKHRIKRPDVMVDIPTQEFNFDRSIKIQEKPDNTVKDDTTLLSKTVTEIVNQLAKDDVECMNIDEDHNIDKTEFLLHDKLSENNSTNITNEEKPETSNQSKNIYSGDNLSPTVSQEENQIAIEKIQNSDQVPVVENIIIEKNTKIQDDIELNSKENDENNGQHPEKVGEHTDITTAENLENVENISLSILQKDDKVLEIEKTHTEVVEALEEDPQKNVKPTEEILSTTEKEISVTQLPTTSEASKSAPVVQDESQEVTDSLGLLAESSRVMNDDDEEPDQDEEEPDDGDADRDDDEDFDPEDENSNNTGEQSEESNPPHSELDIQEDRIDIEFNNEVDKIGLDSNDATFDTLIGDSTDTTLEGNDGNTEAASEDVKDMSESTEQPAEIFDSKPQTNLLASLLRKPAAEMNVNYNRKLTPSIVTKAHQISEVNKSESPVLSGDGTVVERATEHEATDKSKIPEIFNLDSDDEEKNKEVSFIEKPRENNICINYNCTSDESATYYLADRMTIAYYGAARKRRRPVCQNCLDIVNARNEGLVSGIKDLRPLMSLRMARPTHTLLEISDSDSEGEDEPLGEEGARLLEDKLSDMLNDVWSKYNMDERLKQTEDYLEAELQKMEKQSEEVDRILRECQTATDKLRVDFYSSFEGPRKHLPALSIIDTPIAAYACLETEEGIDEAQLPLRYPKRRSTTATDVPAKKAALEDKRTTRSTYESDAKLDEDKDISVVRLSAEAAPPDLPPPGEPTKPPLRVGAQVFAMKNQYGAWLRGKVLDITAKSHEQIYTTCRIRFEHKVKNPCKQISARSIAYTEPCEVRMVIGTRVIALFKNSENATKRGEFYYSGVIAEVPNPVNAYRYLVFFDDGYAQYVEHKHTRLVYESKALVWEEVHPFSRDFVCNYLMKYPERPMVRMHAGQAVTVERNGKWWDTKVLTVDAALVYVQFPDDRTEWIYRGSTRLQPLFTELQQARRGDRSRMPRSTKANTKTNVPYVEYTRSTDDQDKKAEQSADDFRRQRSVAKKSTTIAQQISSAATDGVVSRVVFYTPKNSVRPYKMVTHTCGPQCRRSDLLSLNELRTYNPLTKPLLSGWERQIVRHKSSRAVMYRAPCGRRLRTVQDLHRYLRAIHSDMAVDLFDFNPNTHCLAEFVLNKTNVQKKDLSHGKENVPVPCVNYYDHSLPEFCSYNTERTPTSGVPLNLDPEFLCGCDCEDDCLDKFKCACWKMTQEGAKTIGIDSTNIGYYYRRLPEPLPSGIYECNSRCKCKSTCLNRVVQNPLQLKLQVFKTLNRGWGIRALNDVPKGAFICIYAGNLLTDATANLDGLNEGDEYLAELDYIEVVESMKEGYEDDVPEADKQLDKKESKKSESESESDTTESDDEEKRDKTDIEDDDFQPGYKSIGVTEFNKRLRRRDKKKIKEDGKIKDVKAQTSDDKASVRKEDSSVKKDDMEECITISDDEEVRVSQREPSRLGAEESMTDNKVVPKYRSIRSHFGKDEACYIMDAKVQGNIGRYLNHSCSPNVFVQNVFVDTHDPRFPWVSFFALHHIRAGTELTWNYNYDIGSVPGKVLYCYCGAPNCRGRLL